MSERKLIWIPEGKEKDTGAGRIKVCEPIPFTGKKPKQLWTIRVFSSKDIAPPLSLKLTHGDTGFIEDEGHDWSIRQGHLFYRSRYSDGGCWIMLVY